MVYIMRDAGPRVTSDDIRKLESKVGATLPGEYSAFLMRNNGGRPDPKFFPIQGFSNNPFGQVQDFFGIDDPVESCRLDWKYRTFLGRLPEGFFPIACEDGGSLICIALTGPNMGRIYYWDFYGETSPPTFSNVFLIAETFQQFLDSLQDYDPSTHAIS